MIINGAGAAVIIADHEERISAKSMMTSRNQRRNAVNNVMLTLTGLCALLTVSTLFFILVSSLERRQVAELDLLHANCPSARGSRRRDGQRHCGQRRDCVLAALIGMPIGFSGGIYLAEFGGKTFSLLGPLHRGPAEWRAFDCDRDFRVDRSCGSDAALFRLGGWLGSQSMLIPITARSTEQFLREVPRALREGALALGASKWRTIATRDCSGSGKGL